MPHQLDDSEDDERSGSDLSDDNEEDSISRSSESEEEGEEEGEEEERINTNEAKHQLVEADLAEIKKMMEEMDRIKMRLNFRLAREQEERGITPASSAHRQSSIKEIVVPATATTGAQTAWDLPRMYEMEKVVASFEANPPASLGMENRSAAAPVTKVAELSLHDLARSYGVQDAVFMPVATKQRSSSRRETVSGSATDGYQTKPVTRTEQSSHMWDGMTLANPTLSKLEQSQNSSVASDESKPPRLNRSQLLPGSDAGGQDMLFRSPSPVNTITSHLGDSFGIPASPTNTAASNPSFRKHFQGDSGDDTGKTVEQKEMEAMQSLLFF